LKGTTFTVLIAVSEEFDRSGCPC